MNISSWCKSLDSIQINEIKTWDTTLKFFKNCVYKEERQFEYAELKY